MGGSPSVHQSPPDMMDHHHQYPDMNVIFKGIPKMIQVADDMHRMTDYIMDLRNMTIGLVAISVFGVVGFLLLRLIQGRSSHKRRKRSFIRHAEEGYPPMNRYYYQSQYAPEPWDRPKSTFSHQSQVEEKKPIESRSSPTETRPNGNLPYKSFTNDDQLSPEVEKKSSLVTGNDVSPYRNPPGAHKRSVEPIKLLVEDLPYADS